MMSLTFGLFTQVSGSGPLGPLVISAIGLRCRQRNPNPRVSDNAGNEVNRVSVITRCPRVGIPHPRLGLFGLHQRPMIDYFSYLLLNNSIYAVWCPIPNVIPSVQLRCISVVCKQLMSL